MAMVEPVKMFLSSSLITMQTLVAACHTGRSHKFGDYDPLETYLPHVCYPAEFGRYRSNPMGVRWSQKFGKRFMGQSPMDEGVDDSIETRPSQSCVILANFVF